MNREDHGRARELLVADRVENIPAADREWLDRHLAQCAECANDEKVLASAVQSLRTMHVTVNPEVVRRTKAAVRIRARQLRGERARTAPLWIAVAMSSVLMIATTPYVWRAFAWFGRVSHVPDAMWQAGFVMWWFLPATILAAAVSWRHTANPWRQYESNG